MIIIVLLRRLIDNAPHPIELILAKLLLAVKHLQVGVHFLYLISPF